MQSDEVIDNIKLGAEDGASIPPAVDASKEAASSDNAEEAGPVAATATASPDEGKTHDLVLAGLFTKPKASHHLLIILPVNLLKMSTRSPRIRPSPRWRGARPRLLQHRLMAPMPPLGPSRRPNRL